MNTSAKAVLAKSSKVAQQVAATKARIKACYPGNSRQLPILIGTRDDERKTSLNATS